MVILGRSFNIIGGHVAEQGKTKSRFRTESVNRKSLMRVSHRRFSLISDARKGRNSKNRSKNR